MEVHTDGFDKVGMKAEENGTSLGCIPYDSFFLF
jgi:hypothetical protein